MTDISYNFTPVPINAPYSVTRYSGAPQIKTQHNIWQLGDIAFAHSGYSIFADSPRAPQDIGLNQLYALAWGNQQISPPESDLLLRALEDLGYRQMIAQIPDPRTTFQGSIELGQLLAPFLGIQLNSRTFRINQVISDFPYGEDEKLEGTNFSLVDLKAHDLATLLNPLVLTSLRQPNILAFLSSGDDCPLTKFKEDQKLWFVISDEDMNVVPEHLYAYLLLQSVFNLQPSSKPTRLAKVLMTSAGQDDSTGILCVSNMKVIE